MKDLQHPTPIRTERPDSAHGFEPCAHGDLELVQSARGGCPRAIERLMLRLRCVRATLVARNAKLGAPLDAAELEDVIQDTLIAVWGKLERFEGYGTLEAWTYRFSVLELRSRLGARRARHGARHVRLEDVEERAAAVSDAPGDDEVARVYAGLARLGRGERRVIELKLLEDLTFEEIATRLGRSPNTLKAQYYRGLRKLRTLLPQVLPQARRGPTHDCA
ncbi:MAG: sigma-70 family RNA polymerase sigma factor [bacterium]|nr:sigma-70 family RNA polymerase sigma factor [bacterium]